MHHDAGLVQLVRGLQTTGQLEVLVIQASDLDWIRLDHWQLTIEAIPALQQTLKYSMHM